MDPVKARIEKALQTHTERPVASEFPTQEADGSFRSPSGGALTKVYIVSWDRPPEQDGVPTTAYYEASKDVFWLHEGGGISGANTWFGPFPLP